MRRRELLIVAALSPLLSTTVESAQTKVTEVYEGITEFLSFISINKLAAGIDHRRFRSAVQRLGNSFEQMLSSKARIAALLRREPLDNYALALEIDELKTKMIEASGRLEELAFLLKKEYADDGREVAADLRHVIYDKKQWIFVLERITPDKAELSDYAGKVEKSAEALDKANTALAKLGRR